MHDIVNFLTNTVNEKRIIVGSYVGKNVRDMDKYSKILTSL